MERHQLPRLPLCGQCHPFSLTLFRLRRSPGANQDVNGALHLAEPLGARGLYSRLAQACNDACIRLGAMGLVPSREGKRDRPCKRTRLIQRPARGCVSLMVILILIQ